jgi:hypothetical protein
MLFAGVPQHVRATLLTYIEEKIAGLYGHNKTTKPTCADLRQFMVNANRANPF